jgi:hypothetical protein
VEGASTRVHDVAKAAGDGNGISSSNTLGTKGEQGHGWQQAFE